VICRSPKKVYNKGAYRMKRTMLHPLAMRSVAAPGKGAAADRRQ